MHRNYTPPILLRYFQRRQASPVLQVAEIHHGLADQMARSLTLHNLGDVVAVYSHTGSFHSSSFIVAVEPPRHCSQYKEAAFVLEQRC